MEAHYGADETKFQAEASKDSLDVRGGRGSLAMAGGASASAPATNVPSQGTAPGIVLAEEEISDVSLATFYASTKKANSRFAEA